MTALFQLWPIALSSAFVIVGMAFAYGLSKRGGTVAPELSPADQVAALRAEADEIWTQWADGWCEDDALFDQHEKLQRYADFWEAAQ